MGAGPIITPSSVVVQSSNLLATEVDGEVIMMDAAAGLYFGLDAVGKDVWRHLAQPVRIADLCAALAEWYEEAEPGAIERDVLALVAKLCERRLVEICE